MSKSIARERESAVLILDFMLHHICFSNTYPMISLSMSWDRCQSCMQGCSAWEAGRTGDPAIDYPLLQRISCDDPEAFWPPVFEQLCISFQQRPSR